MEWLTPKRPMKFPYTLGAKLVQFPYKYYWNHSWLFKYWIIASIVSFPIFYKIQKLSRTPENIEKWRETRRKMFAGEH